MIVLIIAVGGEPGLLGPQWLDPRSYAGPFECLDATPTHLPGKQYHVTDLQRTSLSKLFIALRRNRVLFPILFRVEIYLHTQLG